MYWPESSTRSTFSISPCFCAIAVALKAVSVPDRLIGPSLFTSSTPVWITHRWAQIGRVQYRRAHARSPDASSTCWWSGRPAMCTWLHRERERERCIQYSAKLYGTTRLQNCSSRFYPEEREQSSLSLFCPVCPSLQKPNAHSWGYFWSSCQMSKWGRACSEDAGEGGNRLP